MIKSLIATGGALATLVTLSGAAVAWTGLNGNFPKWQSVPVRYEVNAQSAQELGANTAQSVIETSYNNWASPGCSGFRAQSQGTTQGGWRSGDQINTHIWIYNANQRPAELSGRETIGVTLSYFQGNRIIDGDILYNGIDHRWTTNPTQGGQVDAESIITHETGHQLGLGHSQRTAATMYFAYTGGTGARSLDSDDIEGVCSLYPGTGATGCSNDNDCGANETCGGGTCIPTTQGEGGVGDSCSQEMCADDLICVQGNTGGPFCTRLCSGGDCPSGWACIGVNSNRGTVNLCLPSAEGGGDASFGERCDSGPECASGLCVTDGQRAFCTELCMDNDGCPGEATCVSIPNGGGACVPSGGVSSGRFGDPCDNESQCESELCVSDGMNVYCSEYCTRDGECPTGAACYALENGGGACIIEESLPTEPAPEPTQGFNESCDENEDCVSELCVNDGTRTFCSEYCSDSEPCPDGAGCVELTSGGGACLPGAGTSTPSGCAVDTDCVEPGTRCLNGSCVPAGEQPGPQGGMTSPGGAEAPVDPPYDPRAPLAGQEATDDQAVTPKDLGCAAQNGGSGSLALLWACLFGWIFTRARREKGASCQV